MPAKGDVERICMTHLIICTTMSDFGPRRPSPNQRETVICNETHTNHAVCGRLPEMARVLLRNGPWIFMAC